MQNLTDDDYWWPSILTMTPADLLGPGPMSWMMQTIGDRTRFLGNRLFYRAAVVGGVFIPTSPPTSADFADASASLTITVLNVGVGDILLARGYLSILSNNSLGGSNAASDVWTRVRVTDPSATANYTQARLHKNADALSGFKPTTQLEAQFTATIAGTHVLAPQFNSLSLPLHDTMGLSGGALRFEVVQLQAAPATP